jgi:hypothetical protein
MGGARQQGVVLLLLTALRWMEPKVTSSNAFPSTQNKPGMSRELQELQDLEIPSLFSCRLGDEKKFWRWDLAGSVWL